MKLITDDTGHVWRAIEHGDAHRLTGPANQDDERSRLLRIDGKIHECLRGNPPRKLRNGQLRSGTRVSIKIGRVWWHITKSDQPDVNGERPNLYPRMANPKKVYKFQLRY